MGISAKYARSIDKILSVPQVTIITPCFNREQFLAETIESVINQSYQSWEYLIVDDGSQDNSASIALKYANLDNRIRFIERSREPKGAPTCRNIGIEESKGDFIIFLDSDDLMAPYCLEQRLEKINEYPTEDFWVFPMLLFHEQIDDTRRLTNYSTEEPDLYRFLRSDIVWTISCPIWKKSSLVQLGGFDESFPNCQDHDLHLRALLADLKYEKFLDDRPDTFYRKHNQEKIYKPEDPLRVLKGVNMLFLKLAKTKSELMVQDRLSKKNLAVFLLEATRKYVKNQELIIPKKVAYRLYNTNLILFKDYLFILSYIMFSQLGLNRLRGYERLWNVLIGKKAFSKSWGKKLYNQEL